MLALSVLSLCVSYLFLQVYLFFVGSKVNVLLTGFVPRNGNDHHFSWTKIFHTDMIQMAISRPRNMGTAALLMSQQGFGRDLPVPGIRAISRIVKICQLDRIPFFYLSIYLSIYKYISMQIACPWFFNHLIKWCNMKPTMNCNGENITSGQDVKLVSGWLPL